MDQLRLPRLISSGMVVQQKKKVHIWGYDEAGRKLAIEFAGKHYEAVADETGRFSLQLDECAAGGPYTLKVSDDAGESVMVENILCGDVWLCSGQSNMELPMARVIDNYPEEREDCDFPAVRTFKIVEKTDFHSPCEELETGEWKASSPENLMTYSALAYFFGKSLYKKSGVPVGLINVSLGGSRIESWLGRDMLEGYDDFLALAKKYSDDEFINGQREKNIRQSGQWHGALDAADKGVLQHWESEELDEKEFESITLPCFFRDTKLKGLIGSVWFRKHFAVPEEMAGKQAKVWLGTIVDSDTVYINGVQVGHTDYQYPPRKYEIPAGLLKKDNVIAIRVKVDNGDGRFTPGKKYAVFDDTSSVDVSGEWKFRVAAECEKVPETDFVNWKPTGLYNAMTAPCHKYTIGGVVWYQGESNAGAYDTYFDLTKRMVTGYRQKWNDDSLPFLLVQLPNFTIDQSENSGWRELREQQRRALVLSNTGLAVTLDVGEDNDLHPTNKKDIGKRLAALALNLLYDGPRDCFGPQIKSISLPQNGSGTLALRIDFENTGSGLELKETPGKKKEVTDFELRDENGIWHRAAVVVNGSEVELSCSGIKGKAQAVRYAYADTNSGALLQNSEKFLLAPFIMNCDMSQAEL